MPPPEHDEHDDDRLLRGIRSPGPDPAADPADPAAADEADLARLGGIVRSLSDGDVARDEPPPAVWAGIAARAGRPDVGAPAPARPPEGADTSGAPPIPPPVPPVAGPEPDEVDAVPLHARRRRSGARRWVLGAVAAAAAVALVVVGVVVTRDDDEPVVVASARLEPLPDQPAGDAVPVEARVVETDGGLQLDLPLASSGLPAPAGFYEVWLIDPNIEGMVSLGPARADGRYAVPADVDVAAFPIVDVSVEPSDGLPTHSGVSVLRGTLS